MPMKSDTSKMEKSSERPIEISYERVGIFKRISAALFDFFISIVVGFLFLILAFYLVPKFSFVEQDNMIRERVSIESGLYVMDDEEVVRYTDYLSEENLTMDERSELLDKALTSFFNDDTFVSEGISIYLDLKKDAITSDNQKMFDSEYVRLLTNDDYDEEYYSFYLDSYDLALGYLMNNIDYSSASREILLTYILSTVITFLIPLFIFYCLIPLFFKRTRQTLGMKLVKIALIDVDGFSLRTSKYVGRMFFCYLVVIALSIFAFLLPLMLNLGFLVLSKTHQTFVDYIFNTYSVDITNDKIFYDYDEYLAEEKKHHLIRIEDKNYQPAIKK